MLRTQTYISKDSRYTLNAQLYVWNVFAIFILKIQDNFDFIPQYVFGFFAKENLLSNKFIVKLKLKESIVMLHRGTASPITPLATLVLMNNHNREGRLKSVIAHLSLQLPHFSTSHPVMQRAPLILQVWYYCFPLSFLNVLDHTPVQGLLPHSQASLLWNSMPASSNSSSPP